MDDQSRQVPFSYEALYTIAGIAGKQQTCKLRGGKPIRDAADGSFKDIQKCPIMAPFMARPKLYEVDAPDRLIHGRAIWQQKKAHWLCFRGIHKFTMDCAPLSITPPEISHPWIVHGPFAEYAPYMHEVVQEACSLHLDETAVDTLVVIGDSGGAFFAITWAAWLAWRYPELDVIVFAFGCARVFTQPMVDDILARHNLDVYTFQRLHDRVPTIPPRWGNCSFTHFPDPIITQAPWIKYDVWKSQPEHEQVVPFLHTCKIGNAGDDVANESGRLFILTSCIIIIFSVCAIYLFAVSRIIPQLNLWSTMSAWTELTIPALLLATYVLLSLYVRAVIIHLPNSAFTRQTGRAGSQIPEQYENDNGQSSRNIILKREVCQKHHLIYFTEFAIYVGLLYAHSKMTKSSVLRLGSVTSTAAILAFLAME